LALKAKAMHFLKNFWPRKQGVHEHFIEIQFGKLEQNDGHNSAGAVMIFTLMGLISLLGITGFLMGNIDYFWGNDFMEGFHELIANITLLAVVIYVNSVLIFQTWTWTGTGTELIKPTWTGKRKIK
jgi:cytochrome b